MPEFRYRALTQSGEIVSGSITAPTYEEVTRRIEYLGLIPIEGEAERRGSAARRTFQFSRAPRGEEVTILTADLALLLKTGARINDALELLSSDVDVGRLRPTIAKINSAVMSGDSFADALAPHTDLFSPMYIALVRAGETSGVLDGVLETIAAERQRAETLRRQLIDAVRYPGFILLAATTVLTFFLLFVLPQFEAILSDFNAKTDSFLYLFFGLSRALRAHAGLLGFGVVLALAGLWRVSRRPGFVSSVIDIASSLPFVRRLLDSYRTSLFCRNLGILLQSGVGLAQSLRILADIMAAAGRSDAWVQTMDHVRHGGKLSEGLALSKALPPMAIRTLRLGEDSGKLPMLSMRIADFYQAKLERSLDRITGMVGPAAIIVISIIVGGLIVSVMTALLSINQIVG
jgi:general secretion pathway protein F